MTLDRRQIVKRAAAWGALGLLPRCTTSSGAKPDAVALGKGSKVLIVGAGMAGLTAARELRERGFAVTVLEARQRLGGRIWTTSDVLGKPLDLGAAWIHGDRDNPLVELAAGYGVATQVSDKSYPALFDDNGARIPEVRQIDLYRQLKELKDAAYDAQERLGSNAADRPLSSAWPSQLSPELEHLVVTEIAGDYAADARTLSLRHWDKGNWYEGDDLLPTGGYGRLIDGLARGIDVRLGEVVTNLQHGASGCVVTTASGRKYPGDHVVVTVPLGVLKAGTVTFDPPLPEGKTAAVSRLGFGVFNKVVLGFPRRFWPNEPSWLEQTAAPREAWPFFFNLDRYVGAPILVACNVGAYARELETKSDTETVHEVSTVLRRIARRNGWTWQEPAAFKVTRWGQDPFARGSYSHVPVGASLADYDAVGQSVGRSLHFAGEATGSRAFMTVHAAFLSGLAAANRIGR